MIRLLLALSGLVATLAQSGDASITALAAKPRKASSGVDEAAILLLLGLDGRHSSAARCTWRDSSNSTSPSSSSSSSSEGDSTDTTDGPANTGTSGNTTSESPGESTDEGAHESNEDSTVEGNRTSLSFARDVIKSLGFGKRSTDHSSTRDSDLFLVAVVRTGDNVLISRTPATYYGDNPSYNGTMSNGHKFSLSAERSRRRLVSMKVEQDDGHCVLLFELVAGSVLGVGEKSRDHSITEAGIVELQQGNATSKTKTKKTKRKSDDSSAEDSCTSNLNNQTFAFARSSLLAVLGSYWGATWTESDSEVELFSTSTGATYTLSGGDEGDELTLTEGGKDWKEWSAPPKGRRHSGEDEDEEEEEDGNWGLPFIGDSDSTSASCTYTAKVTAGTVMGVSAPKRRTADASERGASRKGPGLRGRHKL